MKYGIYVLKDVSDASDYYSVVIIPEGYGVCVMKYYREFHVVGIIDKDLFKTRLEEKYKEVFDVPEDVPRYVLDHIESEFFEIDLVKKYRGNDYRIEEVK